MGFDLDMTLIDSRPGIKATYDAVVRHTGVEIDTDLVVSRLGPPVELEMARWVDAARVDELADLYRTYYPDHAIDAALVLPGAEEAFAAVRAHGGRVLVITAKSAPHARLHLERIGLEPDVVHGRVWREGKADALRAERAWAYVGDHVDDVAAARSAGVRAVAVSTGPCSGLELEQAGADVVLHSLVDLADWLGDEVGDDNGDVPWSSTDDTSVR